MFKTDTTIDSAILDFDFPFDLQRGVASFLSVHAEADDHEVVRIFSSFRCWSKRRKCPVWKAECHSETKDFNRRPKEGFRWRRSRYWEATQRKYMFVKGHNDDLQTKRSIQSQLFVPQLRHMLLFSPSLFLFSLADSEEIYRDCPVLGIETSWLNNCSVTCCHAFY